MKTPLLDREWFAAKQRALEAYEAKDALGMLEAETTADLLSRKRDLVEHASGLAERLTAMAARVEAEPLLHFGQNTLGEVQGKGLDVDRCCAEIGMLREVIAGINSARNAAARTPERSA
ncbi:MAG: hypothetical protein ACKVU1_04395 [bacterium]